jgi:hypothetical protein
MIRTERHTSSIIEPPVPGAARAVPVLERFLHRLDDASDRLSPMVVKEVRQIVRSREFNWSFLVSLAAGLVVAFIGAAMAAPTRSSGAWVFGALTASLALLGFVVAPFSAFSALRNERLEQTMDLVAVTALSARRIVVGKLFAQAVKLSTFFAAMVPFVVMSFLLGGIDFTTILLWLALVFLGSLWVCAAALLLSSLSTTRAMSGLLVAGLGIGLVVLFGASRLVFLLLSSVGGMAFSGVGVAYAGSGPAPASWLIGMLVALALVTMANLVLLAENRLSSPVEDKATALRVGFFVQFLVIAGMFTTVAYFVPPVPSVVNPIVALCGFHLAIVAAFAVTEDLPVSRRVLLTLPSPWPFRPRAMLRPGGGRGAVYVLAHLALLVAIVWHIGDARDVWMTAALCGYIAFFSGVPALALRWWKPDMSSFLLRVAVLAAVAAALVLPDLLYALFWRPDVFLFEYEARHLINPWRTTANWAIVEREGWFTIPILIGNAGVLAYALLIARNVQVTRQQLRSQPQADTGGAARAAAP